MTKMPVRSRGTMTFPIGNGVSDAIGAFESETLEVFVRTRSVNEHIVLYVLVGMLILALILTSVVKLDRVVTSAGRVVTAAGLLYISPFDTAIVREVRVKAGDILKKGQILATLDSTFTRADVMQLHQKLASIEATVKRLESELQGSPYIHSGASSNELLEGGIWEKRQAEYRSNLADFDA